MVAIKLAVLDSQGVISGYEVVEHECPPGDLLHENPELRVCTRTPKSFEVPPSRVVVPMDCDLGVDRYYWNGREFRPISKDRQAEEVKAPDAMVAIASALCAIRDSGAVKLPRVTLNWLAWWEKTIDAAGVRRQ